jgi:hypothetical protein
MFGEHSDKAKMVGNVLFFIGSIVLFRRFGDVVLGDGQPL